MLVSNYGTLVPRTPLKCEQLKNLTSPLKIARKLGVICAQCGSPFLPTNKRGRVPKYCGRSCEAKAYRQRKFAKELEQVREVVS